MSTPAGWYPDYQDASRMRYWDGKRWSEQTTEGAEGTAAPSGSNGSAVTASGHNGQLHFDGDWVTIFRKGGLARMTVGKGDKRLPIGSITGVQMKPATGLVNGFISFTVPGGNEGRSRFGSQTVDAAKDENAVVFRKSQADQMKIFRDAVERAITERGRPQQVVVQQAAAAPDLADQLTKLAALREQGILTEEEFAAQKAKLLAG